jgi:hypothetical protein
MLLPFAMAWGLAASAPRPIHTPYAQSEKLEIRHIDFAPKVEQYGLEELKLDLHATFDNPFDPNDISVDATISGPQGPDVTVPGFLYRAYQRSQKDGSEAMTASGPVEWRVRICGREVGTNRVIVHVKDRDGSIDSDPIHFEVLPSKDDGFIKVSPRDHRYFEFDSGKSYFPVGANMCWGDSLGTFSYDVWMPDYGKAGANYGRLWLSPAFATFSLEQSGDRKDGKGIGQFDLANSWRLDKVMDTGRANGLYLMLCLESDILISRPYAQYWEKAPQNIENGGPLRSWTDFWTNGDMDAYFKMKLRYAVARWGWDPHVFAWEFWNEVDGMNGYDAETVRGWHQRMAAALKAMDPYGHLRTTSFGNTPGERTIDQLSDLDFCQSHGYGGPDVAGTVAYEQTRKAEYGKPHFFGEVGADSSGPRADIDTRGQQVHDPMWMSLGSGASGTAMCWWWDSLIAPRDLYPLYSAFSGFIKGVDFPGEAFRQTDTHLHYLTTPKNGPRKDLVLENGPISWERSAANQPVSVTVDGGGINGPLPLTGILHGVKNHPELHNPVEFRFTLKQPTKFVVEVGDVSGFGGATLSLRLDNEVVMTKDFPTPAGPHQDALTQYAGDYSLTIPAGSHTLIVNNTGADWFFVGFRIKDFYSRHTPPLQAYAITGNKTALIWVRSDSDTWRDVVLLKRQPEPTPPTLLTLAGLASGNWKTEIWDTWSGQVTSTTNVFVGVDGIVRVPLPSIGQDIAIKMVKEDEQH